MSFQISNRNKTFIAQLTGMQTMIYITIVQSHVFGAIVFNECCVRCRFFTTFETCDLILMAIAFADTADDDAFTPSAESVNTFGRR